MTQIRAGVQEPSLQAAKRYVSNLANEYVSVQNAKRAETNSSTTTTTTFPPSGTTGTTGTTPPPTTPTAAAATGTANQTVTFCSAIEGRFCKFPSRM